MAPGVSGRQAGSQQSPDRSSHQPAVAGQCAAPKLQVNQSAFSLTAVAELMLFALQMLRVTWRQA